jgi:hypothetical protein
LVLPTPPFLDPATRTRICPPFIQVGRIVGRPAGWSILHPAAWLAGFLGICPEA